MSTHSFAIERQEASHIHIVRPSRRQPPLDSLIEALPAASTPGVVPSEAEAKPCERAA